MRGRATIPGIGACLQVVLCAWMVATSLSSFAWGQDEKQEGVEPIPIAEIKRDKPVSFFEEVLPILEEKCLACHSVSLMEGRLNLEEVSTMLKGGKRGPAIIPGRGSDSLLIKVAARIAEPYMPPPDRKDYPPLTSEELGLIKLWIDQGAKDDSEEGEEETIELRGLPPHLNAILAVALSPDGRFVAVGRGNRVQVYDVQTGSLVVQLQGHLDFVQSLAWSPDSRYLASGSFRLVKVWEAPVPRRLGYLVDPVATRSIAAHLGPIADATVVDRAAEHVVTAGGDATLKVWTVKSGALERTVPSPVGAVSALAYAPGRGLLCVAGGTQVALVDTKDWTVQRVWKLAAAVRTVAISKDETLLAAGTDVGKVELLRLPEIAKAEGVDLEGAQLVSGSATPALVFHAGRLLRVSAESDSPQEVVKVDGTVVRAALNPAGTLVAWTDGEGKLFVHDLGAKQRAAVETAHPVTALAWAGDASLVVGTGGPTIEHFNVAAQSGKPPVVKAVASKPLPATPASLVVSPQAVVVALEDGKVLSTTVKIDDPKEIGNLGSPVVGVAVAPVGNRIAALSREGAVLLYDLKARKSAVADTKFAATSVAFDGSGGYLILVGDSGCQVLDASSREPVYSSDTVTGVRRLALWKGAEYLVETDRGVSGVVIEPGTAVATCTANAGRCVAARFSSEDRELICGFSNGTFVAFDPTTGKQIRSARSPGGELRDLAVSPVGNLVVTAMADRQAYVWSYGDFKPYPQGGNKQIRLGGFTTPLRSVAFTGDGARVFATADDGSVRLFDVSTGRLVHEFVGHTATVTAAVPLPQHRLLTVATDGSATLWQWSLQWREHLQLSGLFVHRVLALDYSPDGRLLAAGGGEPSRSGEVKLFDAVSGALVREFAAPHTDTVFGLDFSPDGTMLATASADKLAKIFDLASGQELRKLEGHTHHVLDVTWRWDGQRVVTCGADNVLKVWDVRTGEQVRTIGGHRKQVTSIVPVPRTNQVVSCGADAQVRRYNTDNGGTVRVYGGASDFLYSVSVDNGARWVAAGGQESILFIWRLDNGQLVHRIGPPPQRQVAAK